MKKYDHSKIEKKWQSAWKKSGIYKTKEDSSKPKSYVLDMFPYPSGTGLHVGHPKGYIATDIYSRFKTMSGFNVLHPMGWDAFGLPAEEFALKNKIHPSIAVKKNVKRYKEQLSILGFNYDWSREVNTTDPEYYKWTQWTFLQMYKKGLVFQSHEPINWCPSCKTGLANEDLENGKCERCGSTIEKKAIPQWVIRITDYADRMLKDLELLKDWPESVRESQRNWIGRSEGAEMDFKIKGSKETIKIFTTRIDTLFGVTYLVLAPEHPILKKGEFKKDISNYGEVSAFIKDVSAKTEIERTAEGKEKSGVQLKGITAINPANNEEIQVWIADYVLADYGTGAVMAVPAHDERDFQFVKKYMLPLRSVLEPVTGTPHENEEFRRSIVALVHNPKTDKYLSINWGEKNGGNLLIGGGLNDGEDPIACARREIAEETGFVNVKYLVTSSKVHHHYIAHSKGVNRYIEAVGLHFELENDEKREQKLEKDEQGKFTVEWLTLTELEQKIKDELHSHIVKVFSKNLPQLGDGILSNSGKFNGMTSDKARLEIVKAVGGKTVVRYKLRDWVFSRQRYWGEPIPLIHCPKCGVVPVPEKELPLKLPNVKSYQPTGTGESPLAAIEKWVNVKCPNCKEKARRETNTMPQWAGSSWYYLRYADPKNKKALIDPKKEKYWQPVDMYVGGAEHATRHLIYARFWHKFLLDIGVVTSPEPFMRLKNVGLIAGPDGRKMSKRFGNVVNPDDVVKLYGADTLRVYEMFMGPFEQGIAWSTDNMIGSRRFIEKVWRLNEKVKKGAVLSKELESLLHRTIKKVGEDIEAFAGNTAISTLMILTNSLEKEEAISPEVYKTLLKLLAPFAPHVTDELWAGKKSIHLEKWPEYDEKKLVSSVFKIVVQINSKVRAIFESNTDEEAKVVEKALSLPEISSKLQGKSPEKTIYVKGKLVNFVVSI